MAFLSMTAQGAAPAAALDGFARQSGSPQIADEPVKIQVSHLSAFLCSFDEQAVKACEGNAPADFDAAPAKAPVDAELALEDARREAERKAQREALLAEQHALLEIGCANIWLHTDFAEPSSSDWWHALESWPAEPGDWTGWPESWADPWHLPFQMQETLCDYIPPLPWQGTPGPLLSDVVFPETVPDNAFGLGASCKGDAAKADVIESSGESTGIGCSTSDSFSEDDCASPASSIAIAAPMDGVDIGRSILALIKPVLEDSEVTDDPDELCIDDLLLIKMEEREAKESGADDWNEVTFGSSMDTGIQSTEENVLSDNAANAKLPPRQESNNPVPPSPPPGLLLPNDARQELPSSLGLLLPSDEPAELPCMSPPIILDSATMSAGSGSEADVSDKEECKAAPSRVVEQAVDLPTCLLAMGTSTSAELSVDPPITSSKPTPSKRQKSGPEPVRSVAVSDLSACQRGKKTRVKARNESRQQRTERIGNKVDSQKLFVAVSDQPSVAATSTATSVKEGIGLPLGGRSTWILALGFVGLMVFFACVVSTRACEARAPSRVVPGISYAWTSVQPSNAVEHMRKQRVSSIAKNIKIESARASAVATYLKSKVSEARAARKALKQQKMMERQQEAFQFYQDQVHVMQVAESSRTRTSFWG